MTAYRAAPDVGIARWIQDGIRGFGESVLSVVPAGFAAYTRAFHPAHRQGKPVTWAEIARANGRVAHPGMQINALVGVPPYGETRQLGISDEEPSRGCLPRQLVERLLPTLATHTETPDSCFFGIWEGWGGLPESSPVRQAPAFKLPARRYHLLMGPPEAALDVLDPEWPWYQSPTIWWPEDRAWCVASEIDLDSTYIGSDTACAEEIARLEGIEASMISPETGVTVFTDVLNPEIPER